MPPSIVTIVPLVKLDRGLARKAIMSPISCGVAARPKGMDANSSCHRSGSPLRSAALRRIRLTNRSVATGPGERPTTRRPSFGAAPPSERVKA